MYALNNHRGKKRYTEVHEGTQQRTEVIQDRNMYVVNNYRGK